MASDVHALRPARRADAEAIWDLLKEATADLIGMGSLPTSLPDAQQMCAETADNVAALATGSFELAEGQKRRIFFVLMNTATDRPVGVTGVTFKRLVPNLAVQVTTSRDGQGLVMVSTSVPWTRTELDSSYLAPEARGQGLGVLLSRGRLMMLHPVHRQIPATIASHIRGRFDPDGSAPFWSCFGAHFAPQWTTSGQAELALANDAAELDRLAGHRLPVTAIVLESLGAVNAASLPAFHLLSSEGLVPNGMYDPIDGGPTLVGELNATTSGQRRNHGRLTFGKQGATDSLVSVVSVDRFQVIRTAAGVGPSGEVIVDGSTANAIGLAPDTLVAIASVDGT